MFFYYCNGLYAHMIIGCAGRGQSRQGWAGGMARGAFLSSSNRFAPPRDVLLEEPDLSNPGTMLHCLFLCVCLSVCLVFCLSVCPTVCPISSTLHLSVHPSVNLSIYMCIYMYLSASLPDCLPVCVFVHLSNPSSFCLPSHPFVCPSICWPVGRSVTHGQLIHVL